MLPHEAVKHLLRVVRLQAELLRCAKLYICELESEKMGCKKGKGKKKGK